MQNMKSFFGTFEFQVKFEVEAPCLRPKEKVDGQTYQPAIPFDFTKNEGHILFYDKLPRKYFELKEADAEARRMAVAKRNTLEYLKSIINPLDIDNPQFKLKITDIVVSRFKG